MQMSVTDLKIPLQDPLHWKSLVIKEQGEGVIMRSQASYYHPGRSPLLVKFKVLNLISIISSNLDTQRPRRAGSRASV